MPLIDPCVRYFSSTLACCRYIHILQLSYPYFILLAAVARKQKNNIQEKDALSFRLIKKYSTGRLQITEIFCMSNYNQPVVRRSTYEPLRRRLHSRPSLPRSATQPPTDSQQQLGIDGHQDQKHQGQLPVMGSNMRVYVRCRSRNQREIDEKSCVVISTMGAKGKEVVLSNGPNTLSQYKKTYMFDQVFGAESDQETLFNSVARSYIHEMLQGYNCTVFAYGQTGTGKTYTMSGDIVILGDLESKDKILLGEHAGIIPRVLVDLFKQLSEESREYSVKVSFLELYNEKLKDLLADGDEVEEKIRIFDNNMGTQYSKQNSSNGNNHSNAANGNGSSFANSSSSIMVKGMEEIYIKSANEGLQLLTTGSLKRKVAATKCNDLSSRSHTVFTITTNVSKTDPISGEQYIKIGKLNLVDLAGSENINRSGAENKRAQEAGLINKSLLTLGRVINALVDHSQHIPYRESKLTRLLQDSLGGKTKTCIIATISPAKICMDETVSTLEYATRARSIKNTPQINQSMSKNSCIVEYIHEIDRLRHELKASRQKEGMYITEDQYDLYESNGILVEEQKVRIQNMEEQIKKFKEKYVEQTDLNKKTEKRLIESELVQSTLQEQKREILHTFNLYQASCKHYAEKVGEIHQRNLRLIHALQLERKNIHEASIDVSKSISETLQFVNLKAAELNILNTNLESHTLTFKKASTLILKDIKNALCDGSKTINNELNSIGFSKFITQIQEMHTSLSNAIESFKKTPWNKETDVIYACHREKILACYETINEYHRLIKSSFVELLKKIQQGSKSSLTNVLQVGLGDLDIFLNIILEQRKKLDQLEQEISDNKVIIQKSEAFNQQFYQYFQDRLKTERSNMFRTIIESIEQTERQQMSSDEELLYSATNKIQKYQHELLEHQQDNIKQMSHHGSVSLSTLKGQLDHVIGNLHKISREETDSLDQLFPYDFISESFRNLEKKISSEFNEDSSQRLLKLTDGLESIITSKCRDLESEVTGIVEKTKVGMKRETSNNKDRLQSVTRAVTSIFEHVSKQYNANLNEVLNKHNSTIKDYSKETREMTGTLQNTEDLGGIPQPNELSVDVEKDIAPDLPKLESPRDYRIYEDKADYQNVMPHSPASGRLMFCPSTPLPIPDQPLPRVLAPRSINSNAKRSNTVPIEVKKTQLASTTSNDLKRGFTSEGISALDSNPCIGGPQIKKLHVKQLE
ncbi:hypothetical protein HG535_0H01440 [Zygotorulaspora mrakii]|uniref:Kinesin-like protein KIP1 n=1 Tax=Zygotorulaspora mrakii TaxID=42260 RepID=A0A7H9B886_ZYGMR|nr:uncharacterized protein HG535_0H01440 [Zygotorulaspora mrakii]QLG74817.1 hypothetical protein HG535_0H01440 [Zygotorulaspora mrakii]